MWHDLIAHPTTRIDDVRIAARVSRAAAACTLQLSYRLDGALDDLVVPPPAPVRRGDRLWQHTCFEAFLAVGDAPAYIELNLSPDGAWAAYAFARYRDGGPLALDPEPAITVRRTADALTLEALVYALPPAYVRETLRVGLSAIVEACAGGLSYWALGHPPGEPDFHHADAFALLVGAGA